MKIEDEFFGYLRKAVRSERDRKLVAYYYGFDQAVLPTLDEVGQEFGITGERVRQVLRKFREKAPSKKVKPEKPKSRFSKYEKKIREKVTIHSFPSLVQVNEFLDRSTFLSFEEVVEHLLKENLLDKNVNLICVINLIHELKGGENYGIYNSDLEELTRNKLIDGSQDRLFIIRNERVGELKRILHEAKKIPGLRGLARVADLRDSLQEYDSSYVQNIIDLLYLHPDCCLIEDGLDTWYIFEERDNTLINNCEKLFGIIKACDIGILSDTLHNSLHRRSSTGFSYPSEKVIEQFVQRSNHFTVNHSIVQFKGETTCLTEIENDVIAYFRGKESVYYSEVKQYLLDKGYSEFNCRVAIMRSALVYVDRSHGRYHYLYQVVPDASLSLTSEEDFFKSIDSRLQKILDPENLDDLDGSDKKTDFFTKSIIRREQHILQDYLNRLYDEHGKKECAICGKVYSRSALVTAHKKKRSEASDEERCDRNIVWPLCKFGCDYLYEERIIVIVNGTVCLGENLYEEMTDIQRAYELVDRQIDEFWLQGKSTQFFKDHREYKLNGVFTVNTLLG